MNENTKCIICNKEKFVEYLKVNDRLLNNSIFFTLVKCDCGLIYLNPRPDNKSISEYYNKPSYDPHSEKYNTIWEKVYNIIQLFTFRWKYSKTANYLKPSKVLDIGGGVGKFGYYMQSKGWDVTIQDAFTDTAIKNKLNIINNLNEIKDKQCFDIITLWHSLEHIHNINELFMQINRLLKPNGMVCIAIPNIKALDRIIFSEKWAPYDAPRHLYHFNYQTLNKLCKKYKYNIIRKYSMYQDTPYNILLSFSKINIFSIMKSIIYSILIFIYVGIRGPEYSSSILFICKKN